MKKAIILVSILFTLGLGLYAQDSGTFTDQRDSEVYRWIRIGNQIWMADNLRFASSGSGYYDLQQYGRLYNWESAKRACPQGWHLPSDEEWKTLERFLGMWQSELENQGYFERESGKVGLKLKSKSGWRFYVQNGNGVDQYGFNALPGGYYQYYSERFMLFGSGITFWTGTSYDTENSITREFSSAEDGIARSPYYKVHGCYVRCIRDQ